jgi:hypothetical protein
MSNSGKGDLNMKKINIFLKKYKLKMQPFIIFHPATNVKKAN